MLGCSTAETSLCPFSLEQSGQQELKPTGQAPRLTADREASSPSGVCSRVSECRTSVGRSLGPPLSTVSVAHHHSGLTPLLPLSGLPPPLLSSDVRNLDLAGPLQTRSQADGSAD